MELQKQFEEEYRQHREQIINADAELAQRLAVELGEKGPELDVDQLDLPSTSQVSVIEFSICVMFIVVLLLDRGKE